MSSPEESDLRNNRSSEDQDILERSTKKTKVTPGMEDYQAMNGIEMEMHTEKEAWGALNNQRESHEVQGQKTNNGSTPHDGSYRSILMGLDESTQKDQKEEDLASDDEKDDGDREGNGDCPFIELTKKDKVRLRSSWRKTLIVKVMGRRVGYAYLLRRLNMIWHPKSRMELITLDNDYFAVKFASEIDYEHAKYGGPWLVLDHYLIVKEWYPDFDPMTDRTEKMIVWVRFPGLPLEYYDNELLFRIGEKIGRPIRIDSTTSLTSRGKFARLCVEVDITKPLLAKVWLRRKIRRIAYEGIHLVCFKCGMYGHGSEMCNRDESPVDTTTPVTGGGDQEQTNGRKRGGSTEKVTEEIEPDLSEPFGPWMIVSKGFRKRNQGIGRKDGTWNSNMQNGNGKTDKKYKETEVGGSRFGALIDEDEEGENTEITEEMRNSQNQAKDNMGRPKAKNGPRGRRPNTQINEKKIMGTYKVMESQEIGPSLMDNVQEKETQNKQKRGPNKAGAAHEHVVVHGENNGEKIVVHRVENKQGEVNIQRLEDLAAHEHFNDPPNHDKDFDLNFSINHNALYETMDFQGEVLGGDDHQEMEC